MKSLILYGVFIILTTTLVHAQKIDNKKPDKERKKKNIKSSETAKKDKYLKLKLNDDELEALVENAYKNSYVIKALHSESDQKREKVKQQNLSFLQNFDIGLQLYNFSQDFENSTTVAGLLPNIGLNMKVNLYGLATYRSNVRYAKADLERTTNDVKRQKKILRNWIEANYNDYLLALEILEIRSNILVSIENQLKLEEERFKRGEGKIEDYLKALSGVENIRASLLQAKNTAKKLYRELIIFTSP